MKNKTLHINSLDFIKVCATFAIIYHHYQEFAQVKFAHMNFFYGVFPFHSMVFLFFTISGFFMAHYIDKITNNETDLKCFMKARVSRLLPMTGLTAIVYECILIVFFMLTGTTFNNFTTGMGITGMGVINGFSMLVTMTGTGSGWFWKGPMANEVTWYICVLMLCYIIFFMCCKIAARYKFNVNYAFTVVVIIGLACGSYGISLPFLNANSFQGYIPFFIGVMLGRFMEKREYIAKGTLYIIALIGLICSVIYVIGMFLFTRAAFSDNYWLMFVTFPSLVLVFLSARIQKAFRHRIWGILGGISFNMYVWHFICIIILLAINNGSDLSLPLGDRWFMILFSGVVFIIGAFSYFFIEKRVEGAVSYICRKVRES